LSVFIFVMSKKFNPEPYKIFTAILKYF